MARNLCTDTDPEERPLMSSPTSTATPAETEGFTHRQILVIMSGLMLGMFLAALDQTIVATALPTIVGDFHRSDLLSWVITAYLLASTASTPLWGKAGDLYGRKRVFQLAIVVFLVASALCGASQNMFELIAFRGLQGIGGGGLLSLAFAIIGDVIPPRERGRYQGYFGAVFGVVERRRPAGRRVRRRQPQLALHLLRQPAARHRRADRHQPGAAAAGPQAAGADRLVGRAAARRRRVVHPARHPARRQRLPVGIVADHRAVRAGRAGAGRLRAPGGDGAGADPAAGAVPDPDLHRRQHHRLRQRRRDVRRAGLPAAVPAARARRLGHRIGPAAAAAAGRAC